MAADRQEIVSRRPGTKMNHGLLMPLAAESCDTVVQKRREMENIVSPKVTVQTLPLIGPLACAVGPVSLGHRAAAGRRRRRRVASATSCSAQRQNRARAQHVAGSGPITALFMW